MLAWKSLSVIVLVHILCKYLLWVVSPLTWKHCYLNHYFIIDMLLWLSQLFHFECNTAILIISLLSLSTHTISPNSCSIWVLKTKTELNLQTVDLTRKTLNDLDNEVSFVIDHKKVCGMNSFGFCREMVKVKRVIPSDKGLICEIDHSRFRRSHEGGQPDGLYPYFHPPRRHPRNAHGNTIIRGRTEHHV